MNFLRRASAAGLCLAVMLGCIIYSGSVSDAVTDAVRRCVLAIIPSLFTFMAMSRLIVMTGISECIFKPFDRLLQVTLRLPAGCAGVFMISNIAGYPVGCSMLKEMLAKGRIDKRSAEAMSIYCYSAGPAFMINIIGLGIFGISRIGTCIFLSAVTTNIILAAAANRLYRPRIAPADRGSEDKSFSEALVTSVTSAGEDLFRMCVVIVFFAAMLAVADSFGVIAMLTKLLGMSESASVIFKSAFEITSLNALSGRELGMLPYISAVCGFGGLCVVLQLRTVIGSSFSLSAFLMWMPLKILLNFAAMKVYMLLFLEKSIPAFVKNDDIIVRIDNFVPSICLIMMIFILLFQKRLDFFKRV